VVRGVLLLLPAKENPSLGRLILLRLFFSFDDFQFVRTSLSLAVTLRKEGQVELLGETPKQLSASATLSGVALQVNSIF